MNNDQLLQSQDLQNIIMEVQEGIFTSLPTVRTKHELITIINDSQEGGVFLCLEREFQQDRDIALACIKQEDCAYIYMIDSFNSLYASDREIALIAIKNYPRMYIFAPYSIQRINEAFFAFFECIKTKQDVFYCVHLPKVFAKRKEYMLVLCSNCLNYYHQCNLSLKMDVDIIKASLNNASFLYHLSSNRQSQIKRVSAQYHLTNKEAFQHIIDEKTSKKERTALLKCTKTPAPATSITKRL